MTPPLPSREIICGTAETEQHPGKEGLVAEELKTQCGCVVLVSAAGRRRTVAVALAGAVALAVAGAVAGTVAGAKAEGVVHTGHSTGLGLGSVGVGLGLGQGEDGESVCFSEKVVAGMGQTAHLFMRRRPQRNSWLNTRVLK